MGYLDYPFVTRTGSLDPRRYPGHAEVLKYLNDFAIEFGIDEVVNYEVEVVKVGIVDGNKWKVRSKTRRGTHNDDIYDAVVVCNGHYSQPRLAHFLGTFYMTVRRCLCTKFLGFLNCAYFLRQ